MYFIISFVTLISCMISGEDRILVNTIAFLVCLLFTIVNSIAIHELYIKNHKLFKELIVFMVLITVLLPFIPGYSGKGVVLFGEPSFYALFLGPIIYMWSALSGRFYLPIAILVFFTIWFPSLIFLVFSGLFLLSRLRLQIKTSIVIMFILLFFILTIAYIEPTLKGYIAGRVTLDPTEGNISNLLYMVNIIDIKERLFDLQLVGDGIGATAKIISSNNPYALEIYERYNSMDNMAAGVFLTARLVQTIGVIGIAPVFFVIFNILKLAIRKRIHVNQFNYLLLISILPCLIFRSSGVLSFSTLLLVFIFVCVVNDNENKRFKNERQTININRYD